MFYKIKRYIKKVFYRNPNKKLYAINNYERIRKLHMSQLNKYNRAISDTGRKYISYSNIHKDITGITLVKILVYPDTVITFGYDEVTDPEIHKSIKIFNMKQALYKGK